MFKRLPIENNREGNKERTDSHMLQLLDIFSCDEGMQYLSVVGCQLSVALIFLTLFDYFYRKLLHSEGARVHP
jgi:hypothetical protein